MTRPPVLRPRGFRGDSSAIRSPIGWRIGLVIAGYLAYTVAITVLDGREPAASSAVTLDSSAGSWRAGREVWARNGCATCHSLVGLGGHIGPDLTNYGRPGLHDVVRTTVASGRLGMPSFEVTDREFDDLVAFLASVSSHASYPPRSARDPVFGDGDR